MDGYPRVSAFFRTHPGYSPWMDVCLDRGLGVYRGPDSPEAFAAAVLDEGTVVYDAMCGPLDLDDVFGDLYGMCSDVCETHAAAQRHVTE